MCVHSAHNYLGRSVRQSSVQHTHHTHDDLHSRCNGHALSSHLYCEVRARAPNNSTNRVHCRPHVYDYIISSIYNSTFMNTSRPRQISTHANDDDDDVRTPLFSLQPSTAATQPPPYHQRRRRRRHQPRTHARVHRTPCGRGARKGRLLCPALRLSIEPGPQRSMCALAARAHTRNNYV